MFENITAILNIPAIHYGLISIAGIMIPFIAWNIVRLSIHMVFDSDILESTLDLKISTYHVKILNSSDFKTKVYEKIYNKLLDYAKAYKIPVNIVPPFVIGENNAGEITYPKDFARNDSISIKLSEVVFEEEHYKWGNSASVLAHEIGHFLNRFYTHFEDKAQVETRAQNTGDSLMLSLCDTFHEKVLISFCTSYSHIYMPAYQDMTRKEKMEYLEKAADFSWYTEKDKESVLAVLTKK